MHLNFQFGEDRCTQFRVIVVTVPQTHTPTNTQKNPQKKKKKFIVHRKTNKTNSDVTDRTDYSTQRLSQLARSVIITIISAHSQLCQVAHLK